MPTNTFDNYPLSWKPVKEKLKPPYYKSLSEDLENRIREGLLKPGTKLPPQREIADYLDMNYTSITKVYDICKKKGLIYGYMGKGTFVASNFSKDATLVIADAETEEIDMGALNNFSEFSGLIETAIRAVMEKANLRNLLDYSYPTGHQHQLAAGIRWMEQIGIHTDIDRTAIVTGGQNALTVVLISLFSSGDCIAVDQHTYANFVEMAKMLQIILVPVGGDSEGMSADDLRRKCQVNHIKGIYLMPSCTNPTTVVVSEYRKDELAAVIREKNLILIEDDIGSWLAAAEGKNFRSLFDRVPEQSVYICGMSKSLCPGLRIAYLAYADQFKQQILRGIFNINVKTSSLDAEIITELILSGDAYKLVEHKYQACVKASILFKNYFPEYVSDSERVCFFRWVPIHSRKSYLQVEDELRQRGIRVFHSKRFAVTDQEVPQYLRVSLSSSGSMRKLEKGLSILKEYLSQEHVKA